MMRPFERPDMLHFEAAQGWAELGQFAEANEELEKLSPKVRIHPGVLEIRWQIYDNAGNQEAALDIANAIIKAAPGWPNGWLYRARTLTLLGRTQEAYETLFKAAPRFPSNEYVLYDLGSVCCDLGRFDEARTWIGKAIKAGGNEVKLRALDDLGLEPIWKGIRQP